MICTMRGGPLKMKKTSTVWYCIKMLGRNCDELKGQELFKDNKATIAGKLPNLRQKGSWTIRERLLALTIFFCGWAAFWVSNHCFDRLRVVVVHTTP